MALYIRALWVLVAVTSSLRQYGHAHNLDRISVSTKVHQYLDTAGRVRIFHGTNAVNKGFPWYFDYLLDDDRLDDMQDWGFNIMRLGAMWSGAEPHRDQFNQTYVDMLKKIVDKLASRGIYTMLDMHQDVMSSLYKGYDGIPRWLVETYPAPPHPYPWPLESVGYWEEGYATEACSEGFDYFYNNYNGSVDEWVDFWGYMAAQFEGDAAVIGYDLMNEPWVGDYISKPELLLPGLAGARHLMPAYDKINARVRESDPEGIIFFEPMIYGQAGTDLLLGSGFDRVPGGAEYRNVSSYNFHMYCWALEFIGKDPTDDEKTAATEFCHDVLFPQFFEAQKANTARFGGPSILTEFGLCRTYEDEINVECRRFMDLADEYFVSWNQWDLSWLYGHGNKPDLRVVKPHVRTYAPAVAGVPTTMTFDDDTLDFTLLFEADPSISLPTEIFVPSLRYENGYTVVVSAGLTYKTQGDYLLVYNSKDMDLKATVKIKAKAKY